MISAITRLNHQIKSFTTERDDLVAFLRDVCKHTKVEETSNSHYDDWDGTTETYWYRQCLTCGFIDSTSTYGYGCWDTSKPVYSDLADAPGRTTTKVSKLSESFI
jgi:hypothetical protein